MKADKRKLICIILAVLGISAGVVLLIVLFPNLNTSPPEKTQTPGEPLIVCLDAGHGGDDPGTEGGGRQEKNDNLRTALLVREKLQLQGITCYITRTEDINMDLASRIAYANGQNATVFASIHRNSGGGEGVEIWIKSNPAQTERVLANTVLDGIIEASGMNNRGVKRGTAGNPEADYAMNKAEAMTCLIELGFADNDTDNTLFDTNFEAIAEAIANGIIKTMQ